MDDQRFDDLSRRLARGVSRRQVLKALAGGVLGGMAGAFGLGKAAAACATDRDCPPGERCDASTASCVPRGNGRSSGQGQSQSQTVGIAAVCTTDADCAPNETCVDGVCTPRGGGCTRGSGCESDATCCGGEVCDTFQGTCVGAGGPCTNTDGTCTDSTDCCGNEECIGDICQQTAGGCAPGSVCAGDAECCGGQVCADGTCVRAARQAGCSDGQVRCSGTCVDILTDPTNCGACGIVCDSGTCANGDCEVGLETCQSDADCGGCTYCRRAQCIPCTPCNPCDANGQCSPLCPSSCDECTFDTDGNPVCVGYEVTRGPCFTCDRDTPGSEPVRLAICEGCVQCDNSGEVCVVTEGCPERYTCELDTCLPV